MRINSFTIGSFTATGNQHVAGGGNNIRSFEGLESPTRRVGSFDLSGQHGAFITSAFYGGRVLAVAVELIGSTVSDFESRQNTMNTALDLSSGESEMTVVTKGGDSYTLTGYTRIAGGGPAFGELKRGVYTFEFFCDDYRILSATESTETLYLNDGTGGTAIPTAVPVSLAPGSGGVTTVTNSGNAAADLTITITGPLDANITVRNSTTDQKFIYQADIAASEFIIIDTGARTVLDHLGANKLGSASAANRDFFKLQPGDNELLFYHDGPYDANANAVFSWYDSYVGI